MNKKLILCLALATIAGIMVFPPSVQSQNERVDLSSVDIESYIAGKNVAGQVLQSYGPDYSAAYDVGWQSINEVFGLEGMVQTLGEEVIGMTTLKTINEYCGEIGLGMALVQLTIDIYQGNYGTAAYNFSKNLSFYSIGKWGTSAMKITAVGVGFIDYALNKFATAAVEARVGTWKSAYFNYYENGPGKRNLKQWEEAFSKAESKEDIEKIMLSHLNKFWGEVVDPREYADVRTLGPYQAIATPLPDEQAAIRNAYMQERLLPYLTSLFNSMAKKAKDQATEKVKDYFKKVAVLLNTPYEMHIVVVGPKDRISGIPVKIGNWEGATDAKGEYLFKCTLYGYMKGEAPKEVVIKVTSKEGEEKELRENVVLRKGGSTITFQLGGIADIKGLITNEETKEPVKGAKVSIPEVKVSTSTNASGEYLLKNVPNGEYQIEAQHNAYDKKSVPLTVDVPEEEKNKPTIELNIELKPIPPTAQILFPKQGQLVEKLQFNIQARVNSGGAGLKKEFIKMLFDGNEVEFSYDESSGDINYTTELLKEDIPTKAKHTVTLSAEITDQKGQQTTLSKTVNFTAGIRPVITELQFNNKYLEDPDKEPLFTGQIYDEHSGPDPGSLMVLLNGNPVKVDYGVLSEQWLNIAYFPTKSAAMRGGENNITVTIKDNAGIPSQSKSISFRTPGPEIQLVKPVDPGKVISGDVFMLAVAARNIGSGPAKNLRATLYCNDRPYASLEQATSSFGDIEPAMEGTGAPFYKIKTAKDLGNPENGEPVYCNFTIRFYQASDPKQFWEDKFSVPIYPGEMQFGTVYVKLIHGTYMEGEWPVHTAYQTVCLDGTGGNFTAISDANGNATFENIPPGEYTTYVPGWYTYGAKLGEYIKNVTVTPGGYARATLKGSCPYIYVWDGKKFEKDNDIYSTARILGKDKNPIEYIPTEEEIKKTEYTDYLYIQKNVLPKEGHYVFRLEEIRNEISWTDFAKLIVVDHPKGTKISCDEKGNILSYKSPKGPVSAFDEKGNDLTSLLKKEDSKSFRAFHQSSLTLKFTDKEKIKNAKLVIRMKGFERIEEKWEPIPGKVEVQIQTKDKDGNWQTRYNMNPRNEWDIAVFNLTPFLSDENSLEVRLFVTQCRSDKYHLIDFVGLDTSKDEKLEIKILDLKKAVHSTFGDITEKLLREDRVYAQTYPQEWIELYFDKLESSSGERNFIFVSRGHYLYFEGDTAVRLKP